MSEKDSSIKTLPSVELLVIGGGINGAGIANDAAGRGLKVSLYESNDFASATSSASSKLLHGGLRYLELYEFRLVAEALKEREVLLKKAPHLVSPLRFILPHSPALRPAWLIRAGLFLYDRLSLRNSLEKSVEIDLSKLDLLTDQFQKGFEYSDCWVDDARLVVINIVQAKSLGAEVHNYCEVTDIEATDDGWLVTVFDKMKQQHWQQKARVIVNAAGPWVGRIIDKIPRSTDLHSHLHPPSKKIENNKPDTEYSLRLIKGSHIVLPKQYSPKKAFILQNDDQRIVFVIPYLEKFTMVGTTDLDYQGSLNKIDISAQETRYLLDVVNKHFKQKVQEEDIIWSFSGVRPLATKKTDSSQTAQAVSRDYILAFEQSFNEAAVLHVYGGKITTYRRLAESALRLIAPTFPEMKSKWTESKPLPGGDFSVSRETLAKQLIDDYPFINAAMAIRYISLYGTLCWQWLSDATCIDEMGEKLADDVYAREIDYLMTAEFAKNSDDILWRRTKLGLFLTPQQQAAIEVYLQKVISENTL